MGAVIISISAKDNGNQPLIHDITARVGRVSTVFTKSEKETEKVSIISIIPLTIVNEKTTSAGKEVYSLILQNNFIFFKIPPDK